MADSSKPMSLADTSGRKPRTNIINMVLSASWMKQSRFYPAEFLLMLLTSSGLITATSILFGVIINHWLNDAPGGAGSMVVYLVSTLLVLLPIHVVLYWRVRHTDPKTVTRFSQRIANAGLGLHIIVLALAVISIEITLVYTLLQWLMGLETDTDNLVSTLLVFGQAILWLKLAIWHFAKLRGGAPRAMHYVVFVKIVVLLAIVLGLVFPGSVGRDAARDDIKVADLETISDAIDEYVGEYDELPATLEDLESLKIKGDLDDYEYTPGKSSSKNTSRFTAQLSYEICATFSTATGKSSFSSYSFYYHDKGRQCFERTAYGTTSSYEEFTDDDSIQDLQRSFNTYY